VALVCLIGSNIDRAGLLGQAASALAQADVNIKSAGFALRKVNIQFVIGREDYKNAIVALNNSFKLAS
jgi:aspartate kinase